MRILRTHIKRRRVTDQELEQLYLELVSFAMKRTSCHTQAIEVVHEAMVSTLDRISRLGSVDNLRAYCFKVLRTKFLDQDSPFVSSSRLAENAQVPPDIGFFFHVEQLLSLLPKQEGLVVRAVDIDGQPLSRVAQRMGLSVSYAEKILCRGHTHLKLLLRDELPPHRHSAPSPIQESTLPPLQTKEKHEKY